MVKPRYSKARRAVKIPLHSVIHILSEMEKAGHTELLKSHLKDQEASLTLSAKTINIFKDYVAENKLHEQSQVLSSVVGSDGDYECPYKER